MKNGLYSIHVSLLDGNTGKGSGVVVLRDGEILGGDAFLFYVGSYTMQNETFRGEVVVNQHTPSKDVIPLFGGRQVSIGIHGKFAGDSAEMEGTALVGKASQFFRVTFRKLAEAR